MLWAFIPDKTLVSVGPLPSTARRLDTGELVADVAKWAHACGYWDLDSPTVTSDFRAARTLTTAEFAALLADVQTARGRRDGNEQWATGVLNYLVDTQQQATLGLERYGDGQLGIPGFGGNIGALWPTTGPTRVDEQLIITRRILTRLMHNVYVMAHLQRVLVGVVRDLVRDVDIPDPPQLG